MPRQFLLVILLGLGALAEVPAGEPASPAASAAPATTPALAVDFAREIRPILSDKCFACHGPDEKHREADLRLDTRDGVFQHPGKRKVVVSGKLEASELWRRITHDDPDQHMPPPDSGKSLNDKQRSLLRRWIEQGAEWHEHWSFAPVVQPAVPAGGSASGPVNEIDRFVLARLDRDGLGLAPEADPRTLIRRYAFDLTGLPPTPDEVRQFVQQFEQDRDKACADLAERLLNSPHFGERLAMSWLDLVRYADTVGYHGDQDHPISPYRDWVIQAFNDNMPFDRFATEQIAGDLLPGATVDQKIASGYNRLLQTSHEGGVQQKEYLAKYSADRVRNFGAVWLGVTLGCAECHDHKYDPFPQRDFYRLAAFFADVDDIQTFRGGDTNPTRREPELEVLSEFERRQLAALEQELRDLESKPDAAANSRAAELKLQIETLGKQKRRTMITVAIAPRPIRVLARGDWMDDSGEVVQPGVPVIFRQIAANHPPTRLDLARWLTSPDQPLAARVFVNRLWKLYFGKGLAPSLDDLGSQGQAPVHPELLDWLAAEFIESHWDVKRMVRLIVLSRVYRQSSLEAPAQRQRDPENRLLARQSRPRLDAELIRDNALAVSGLLTTSVGGPSARPYQPDGYQQLRFPVRSYVADQGQQQYRRGVYTHWQRSFLHPMLKAFDAPSREECTAQRPTSNTPQAALVLLNDPTFVEAARAFAVRILREGGSTVDDRLRWAWQAALSRDPNDREMALVRRQLDQDLSEFRADAASAEQLLKVGQAVAPADLDRPELAAWTSAARTIFNLHEFITRN